MGQASTIEWTEVTWNPVTGCSKVSPGCAHCYAETLSRRFGRSWKPWTPANAADNVTLHPERVDQPRRWRTPRLVFVNSMSDLFHELVPADFIASVFATMAATPQHTYQVLTKRPERMCDLLVEWEAEAAEMEVPGAVPLANVWLGTSIENNRWVARAHALRDTPSAVRFVSAEPLLGPLDQLDLAGVDWLIIGGESGPRARRMNPEWALDLVDACERAGVACFVKQLWSVLARELGLPAKGGGEDVSVFPSGLRVRQMPLAA